MLKEIRIKVDKKTSIDDITLHALNIGYPINEHQEPYYLKAKYLFFDPNKAMVWGDKDKYITALSYEEMTAKDFLEYRRK